MLLVYGFKDANCDGHQSTEIFGCNCDLRKFLLRNMSYCGICVMHAMLVVSCWYESVITTVILEKPFQNFINSIRQ